MSFLQKSLNNASEKTSLICNVFSGGCKGLEIKRKYFMFSKASKNMIL